MKKLISAAVSAVMFSQILPLGVLAEESETAYIPMFYMKAEENSIYTVDDDGTLVFSRENLSKDVLINTDIFFEDNTLSAWSVSPRWKASSDFIEILNYNDPLGDTLLPFAYAETNEKGEIIRGRTETALSVNKVYHTINYTVRRMNGDSLVPYGKTSEDYPLISFDFNVHPNIPYGEYELFFMTGNENSCRVAMNCEGLPIFGSGDNPSPRTQGLKIRVEGAICGDVNNDGMVNSSDASYILAEFARIQTGQETEFTELQTEAADVNFDGKIDSSDASDILIYYAYSSTTHGEIQGVKDYFKR